MKHLKRILFILGAYYPNYSANGLCCKNVVDECVENGYKVSCIVNSVKGYEKPFNLDGAKIFPIKPKFITSIYNWFLNKKTSKFRKLIYKISIRIYKIKQFIMAPFWPLVSPIYNNRFYNEAKKLCKKNEIDIIVAVYTPLEAIYAGCKIKRKYKNIKFVSYYLDALYGGLGPKIWNSKKINRHTKYWESKINDLSDLIISMEASKKFHTIDNDVFAKKRYYLDIPALNRNAYELRQAVNKTNTYVFIFAGSIQYPMRNPIPILNLLLELSKTMNIEVEFIGNCNNKKIFDYYNIKSNNAIRFIDQISHNEILEKEYAADFLINIGIENSNLLPSKIFEYMKTNRPIISTFCVDDDPTIEYLKKYGKAFFVDQRKNFTDYINSFKKFIIDTKIDVCTNADINKLFYKNTPKAFVDLIEEKLEK